MKRFLLSLLFFCLTFTISAQNSSEEEAIKKTVDTFFEGFHARDSVIMKSVLADDVVVQTIGKAKSGEIKLHQEDIHKVLNGIVSIPLETSFKEVLLDYQIKIDGNMANAWTPYLFFLNETFSHCGVNNFQLFKENGDWKIIYLIDTRRREGCEEKKLK
ncbi:nuclear transport factor 2 family protein [Salinimicrobium catena]|uniref:nuclear transport factor 2 family protein n=1 Tax=Salinimicrobium catena TaxID=390640 RepID=UPI002FE49D56